MRDVARAAGVSQASVSYTYSGTGRVSEAQREAIFAAATRLGYTGPNIAASTLRLGRIGTVGVLVPGSLAAAVVDPSTALLLKGIVEVGELADVALTLLPVQRSLREGHQGNPVMPSVLRGLVDGVVMHCLPSDHPVVSAVLARGIPAVAIDSPRLPGLPYVTINHRRGGAAQMHHVLQHGHKRIGVISDRLGEFHIDVARPLAAIHDVTEMYLRERLAGYRDAIAEADDPDVEVTLIEAADIDAASGMVAAGELIAGIAPSAIVTTSDVHAIAALKVLEGKGLSVPGQVSVIGFDDAPIADLMGLTTIHQPLCEKGRTAATILLDLIAGRTRLRSVKTTELVVRFTTGPAPASVS